MIEINKDSENLEKSPFQEEIVLENYFPCVSRAEVLSQMKQAVANGVALMVLTGEEGSGKTMLCRVLENEVLCQTVFFAGAVDSFEEVVQNIAVGLGLKGENENNTGDIEQSLQHIIDFLLNQPEGLLVIFDEAENIFLANLERIRKMLDLVNGAGARMHILLSGRETLLENCDQISLCNFRNADERHFELPPLFEAETADYLRNCAARLTGMDAAKVFTNEVVSNIYTLAQGNFRMTNILGEETVKPHNDDTSFMVLLDGVEEEVGIENENPDVIKYPQLLEKITTYLPWIGGAVCCFLLLFYLFSSGGDKSEVGKDMNQNQKADQIEKVVKPNDTGDSLSEKKELTALAPVEESQPPDEEETMGAGEEEVSGKEAVVVPPAVEKAPPLVSNQEQSVVEQAAPETGKTAEEAATAGSGDNAPVAETEEKEAVTAVKVNPPQEEVAKEVKNIGLLRPGKQVKKKLEVSSEQQSPLVKTQPPKKAVPNVAVPTPHSTVNQLYNARLSAGSGWERAEKKKMFTIQVMALASKTAEENLKKILAQVNYRKQAGNFYILKKKTAPEGVFVFYGEYASIDSARLAQKSLPQFLRDHKPYALSIKSAIAKVGK